ncbi:MAG: Crp/Fnr family transcriptional regulator [Pseudomonadota bacterium]
MATDCKNCPLRKRGMFRKMTAEEVRFMRGFKRGELVVNAGSTILMEGSNSPQLFTALHGIGLRYKTLASGARQVVNFVLPGDFVGLQAGVLGEMKHSVEAVTPMTLCVFSREDLWSMFRNSPERAYDLTWLAALEEHFMGETLASVGRREGLERVAWGLVKYFSRLDALGIAADDSAPMPFRQQDLADALGLSLVHTNKLLRKLREQQVARWDGDQLRIMDFDKLKDIAGLEDYPVLDRPLI